MRAHANDTVLGCGVAYTHAGQADGPEVRQRTVDEVGCVCEQPAYNPAIEIIYERLLAVMKTGTGGIPVPVNVF